MNMKYLLIVLSVLSLWSCKKFDNELAKKESDSGLVLVQRKGGGGNNAKIDEEIEVFAKVGDKNAGLQFYVGNVATTPLSRESRMVKWNNYGGRDSVLLPMEVFTMLVPKGATLGPSNVYFTVNGVKRAPLELNIARPDILYPGKVLVEPFVVTPRHDFKGVDGPLGSAVVGDLIDITYDENSKTFYFLESYYKDDNYTDKNYFIRKLQGNVLTTLAGGGKDGNATEGKQRDLGRVMCMRPGPDGQLYLGTVTSWLKYSPDLGHDVPVFRPEIIKIDPQTGRIQHVAGGLLPNGYVYEGIRDGKEGALLLEPSSMAFDKTGNLYFLDAIGALVRKVTPDGTVSTVFGGVDSVVTEIEDPVTGEPIPYTRYYPVREHSDGFGKEVRFTIGRKIVMAGNGKLYVLELAYSDYRENIREINPDTKEVSTVVGQPVGSRTYINSGTFKEVDLQDVLSFDVDFDGNILFTRIVVENFVNVPKVYRMDLQKEMVMYLAGGQGGEIPHDQPQPGDKATFAGGERIVFDQFGTLYILDGNLDVQVKKITIER